MLCAGILLGLFYSMFDFRITLPVFAVYSSFFEIKLFTIIRTNIADEIILLILLMGFIFISFSRERNERKNDGILRANALYYAMISNAIFLIFAILFVFGQGFITILILNIFSVFIFYLFYFYRFRYKEWRKSVK